MSRQHLPLFPALVLAGLVAGAAAQAQPPAGDAIVQALLEGMDGEVEGLIARKADVNAVDDAGVSALALAVAGGKTALAASLLKAGADPDLADANGSTPLFVAVENGSTELVTMLLDAGANPNVARAGGETPLMLAVRGGSVEAVRLLLARKAKVNAAEAEFGQTPLMMSVGQPEVMKLLLAAGADLKARTRSWMVRNVIYTPATGTLGLTGIPWNNDGTYAGKMGGTTALLFAAQQGDMACARLLVEAGADVNAPAADGTTPLLASLYRWQIPAGRQVDTEAPMVARPLGGLTFASDYAMANYLLDKGARVNVADRAGYTPLHGALVNLVDPAIIAFQSNENGQRRRSEFKPAPEVLAPALATIKRLLEAGADSNRPTLYPTPGPVGNVRVNPAPQGSTPMHVAAQVNDPAVIALLVAHGGNPNVVRKDGQSPFSVAAQVSNLEALKVMVAGGANLKMLYNPTEKVADPVLSKAEPRANVSVLHIAAVAGADTVIEYLVSAGAPLDVVNDHGETAAQLADHQERFRFAKAMEGFLNNGTEGKKKPVRSTALSDAFRRASAGPGAAPAPVRVGGAAAEPRLAASGKR